jgi:uncharacterized protein (DUF952 family)
LILHITSRVEWQAAQARGDYRAPSLETEGFIHMSTPKQVLHVANAFYRGQSGLILLVVDETHISLSRSPDPERSEGEGAVEGHSRVKWEAPAGPPASGISQDDLFPHVYGPLNLDAIVDVLDFNSDANGDFHLPASLMTDN